MYPRLRLDTDLKGFVLVSCCLWWQCVASDSYIWSCLIMGEWGGYIVCVMEENFTLKLLYNDQIVISYCVEFIECLLEWLNLESFSPAPASRCSTAKPFTLLQFVCSDTNSLFLWKHSVWTEVWTFPGGDLVALWLPVHLILPLRWWEVMPSLDSMLLFFVVFILFSQLLNDSSFHSLTVIIPIMCL